LLSSSFLSALVIILFLASGCTPFRSFDQKSVTVSFRVIADVPLVVQQGAYDCGPAAISTLLAHRGIKLPIESVTQAVSTPQLGGSLLADLENFARQQGLVTRSGSGTQELLRRQIDAGRPVIVMLDTGFWLHTRSHYIVVTGYDTDGFVVHSGKERASYIFSRELSGRWAAMNNLYLYLE
jgi:ABC-type bacteriocin/lantibiotic exporter with double-glycine peptidase domain